MTAHSRIPLNQGVCGAAASTGKTVVVDDVSADQRYLACSLETKSEIVVPVFVHGKVAGELDIDSTSTPPLVPTIADSANTQPPSSANSSRNPRNQIVDVCFLRGRRSSSGSISLLPSSRRFLSLLRTDN
jgi:GAF domain-containing protein